MILKSNFLPRNFGVLCKFNVLVQKYKSIFQFYGFAYNDGTSAPAGLFDTGESSNGNEEDQDEDEDVFESEPVTTGSGTTSESGADTQSNGSFEMVQLEGNEPEGSAEEVPIKKLHHAKQSQQHHPLPFKLGMEMCGQGMLAIARVYI